MSHRRAWLLAALVLLPTAGLWNQPLSPVSAVARAEINPQKGAFELLNGLSDLPEIDRYAATASLIRSGQVPDFLQELVPVRFSAVDAVGITHDVEIRVTPDYASVGTDDDFVRVPVDWPTARQIARDQHMWIPTPLVVDQIWRAASVVQTPRPLPPCDEMRTVAYLLDHEALVSAASPVRPDGRLWAGHKKDVVMTPRHLQRPGRVAIYGWHQADGVPIQGVSLWHTESYADYSHGLRLVARDVEIDGNVYDALDVLENPIFAPLLSNEGAFDARAVLGIAGEGEAIADLPDAADVP
jgi:hypothetical protein